MINGRECIGIVLSGGVGTRVKGVDTPKQYIEVNGKTIIEYTLTTVAGNKYIDRIVVVCNKEYEKLIGNIYTKIINNIKNDKLDLYNNEMIDYTNCFLKKEIIYASPGENRQFSILNGLKILEGKISDNSYVAIIDAARPKMSDDILNRCFENMTGYDGVLPVLPMKDTVYMSDDGKKITSLLDRNKILAGQAPEVFEYKKYLDANVFLSKDEIMNINGSSEVAVKFGMNIAVIEGDEKNYKITTNDDLERFKEEFI